MDLTIDNARDIRCYESSKLTETATGGLFAGYKFENNEGQEIFDFMEVNAHKLREVSMRMALKIADLFKVTGVNDWRTLAESTCMKVR